MTLNIFEKRIKAWAEQYGALSPEIQRKIDKLVEQYDKTQNVEKENKVLSITDGTKLIREFKGKRYSVTVSQNGYEYNGKKIQSFEPDKIFLRTTVKRVDLKLDCISISYDINYIIKYFVALAFNAAFKHYEEDEQIITNRIDVRISLTQQRQNKIIIPGKANYDMKLIQAIVKSFWYNKLGAEKKLPIEARNGNNKRLRKLRFITKSRI